MINNLFKSALQHESPDKRIRAINKLSGSEDRSSETLYGIAMDDVDSGVRAAALGKLMDPELVLKVANSHPDESTRVCAESAFCTLLGSETSISENQLKELGEKLPDFRKLIAAHCSYTTLRNSLIASFTQIELATMVATIPANETRLYVAELITERDALELARKELKGKDKNAERIVKQKIDHLNIQERTILENDEVTTELFEKMEVLASHHDWREETKNQFLVLLQRWEDLDFEPNDIAKNRFEAAQQKVSGDIEEHASISNSYAKQEKLTQELEDSCLAVSNKSLDDLREGQPILANLLTSTSKQWTEEHNTVQHKLAVSERFIESAKALEDVLSLIQASSASMDTLAIKDRAKIESTKAILSKQLKKFQWPKKYATLSCLEEIHALFAEQTSELEALTSSANEKLEKLHKRVNRILNATQKGSLQRSRQELAKLKKAVQHYSGNDRKALDDRIEKAEAAVVKMGDWKDFVTEPKLIECCEEMEKLATNKTPNADKQAKKIKALQEKWKGVGDSDISEQHWPRFKLAADTAYEPCALAFKEKRERQKLNLKKRIPIIEALKDLVEKTNWEADPDYATIEKTVRELTNDWQKVKDVDQRGGQKQWNEFSKLKDSAYDKLSAEYDRNIGAKNSLVNQLDEMLAATVDDSSFPKLQFIQKKWKQIGITRRQQDQKLWKRFKKTSDQVYEQIQASRNAVRNAENEQINQYRDTHKMILALAKNCTDLAEGDQQFEELKQQRSDLPALPKELPEKMVLGLEKDFNRACAAFEKCRDKIINQKKSQGFDLVKKAAELCSDLEALPQTASKDSVAAIQVEIESLEITDKAISKRIAQRISSARIADRQEFTIARQKLCIEMEISADVSSPKEDQALRTKIQLEKLQNLGIGHSSATPTSNLKELQIDWLCIPGADSENQIKLDKRVQKIVR